MIQLVFHDDVLSMELSVDVVEAAPGWSVVSTADGRVYSRHATEAQARYAARHLCSRSSSHFGESRLG